MSAIYNIVLALLFVGVHANFIELYTQNEYYRPVLDYLNANNLEEHEKPLYDYLRRPSLATRHFRTLHSSDKKRYSKIAKCKWAPSEKPYIPFITHHVWLSDPSDDHNMNIMASNNKFFQNTFDSVALLNQDKEDWVHYFWTNSESLVQLDEEICQGKCKIMLVNEENLSEYNQFKPFIEEMIAKGHYSIDHIRVLALKQYGGLYIDGDVQMLNTTANLHYHVQMYTGIERNDHIGLGTSTIGTTAEHPVITTWFELLQEYHGLIDNKRGVGKLFPDPIQCEDFMRTTSSRMFNVAFLFSNNQGENCDVVFHEHMVFQDFDPRALFEYKIKWWPWVLYGECSYDQVITGDTYHCYQQHIAFQDGDEKKHILQKKISNNAYSGAYERSCKNHDRYHDISQVFISPTQKGNMFDRRYQHPENKELFTSTVKNFSNEMGELLTVYLKMLKGQSSSYFEGIQLPGSENKLEQIKNQFLKKFDLKNSKRHGLRG